MLPAIKVLKVGLPLATAASATAITASLVSTKREDVKLSSKDEDKILEDFERPSEIFEEQIITYPQETKNEEETDDKKDLKELVKEELGKADRKKMVEKLLKDPEALVEDLLRKQKHLSPKEAVQQILKESGLQEGTEVPQSEAQDIVEKPVPQAEENEVGKVAQEAQTVETDNSVAEVQEDAGVSSEAPNLGVQEIKDVLQRANQELQEKMKSEAQGGGESETVENNGSHEEQERVKAPDGRNEEDLYESSRSDSDDVGDSLVEDGGLPASPEEPSMSEKSTTKVAPSEGHQNGLKEESGNEPITEEQLARMSEIAIEATSVLTSLESLLQEI